MGWTIKFTEFAEKQLRKLDKAVAKKILKYFKERVLAQDDPRKFGKTLLHDKSGLWRFRVDDYRIICKLEDHELTILVVRLGHRKDVYE